MPGTMGQHYEFATKWGSQGSGDGQFLNLRGIAVDNSGNVYVVDEGNNRIQKFTADTSFSVFNDALAIIDTGCNDTNCVAIGGATTISGDTTTYTAKIYTSTDLTSWTEKYVLSLPGPFKGSVSFLNGNVVVLIYSYDSTANKTTIKMIRSPDNGNTWTETYSEKLTGAGSGYIKILNNTFVVVLSAYNNTEKITTTNIRFSTDGHGWVSKKTETIGGQGGGDITYGNNTFVASLAGFDSTTNTTSLKIFTSIDNGNTWTEKPLPVNTLIGSGGISVVFGNNVFVSCISAVAPLPTGTSSTIKIFSSIDNGNTWTETYGGTFAAPGGFSSPIIFKNNTFLGILYTFSQSTGYTIKTITSTNGTSWVETTQTIFGSPPQIQFLNNSFILTSVITNCVNNMCIQAGTDIFLSNDGITWEKRYTDKQTTFRITYCMDSYIAFGAKDGKGFIKKISLSEGGGETPHYTLTVTKTGSGTGTVSATGLTCSNNQCTGEFNSGTLVNLTALAELGSTFAGWSGAGCSGTGTCAVTMDGAKSLIATFNIFSQTTGAIQLPKTGETKCYNASGTEIACSGTKHDGDIQAGVSWPNPRFTDNGDGTVTDNLTGLIWLKNASCNGFGPFVPWSDALMIVNLLASGQCGLTDGSQAGDWRMPNINELYSLIDFSKQTPALPEGHLFSNVISNTYWTSTTKTHLTTSAWQINLNTGRNAFTGNKSSYFEYSYVLPVRLAQRLSNIDLNPGWNFISLPKQPTNIEIASALTSISTELRIVWGFDNSSQNWLKYSPSAPSGNLLTTIETHRGYWVYMNKTAILDMEGWIATDTTVSLHNGWNLIGYYGIDNAPVEDSLSGLGNKWVIIWGWENGVWKAKVPQGISTNINIPELTTFKKGKAYWIKMNASTEWKQ